MDLERPALFDAWMNYDTEGKPSRHARFRLRKTLVSASSVCSDLCNLQVSDGKSL